jgi:hypothetical protein
MVTLAGKLPLQALLAVHVVPAVAAQVRVVLCPATIVVGFAVRVTDAALAVATGLEIIVLFPPQAVKSRAPTRPTTPPYSASFLSMCILLEPPRGMLCFRLVRARTRAKGFSANFSANILLRRNACQATFMMMGRASRPLAASDAEVAPVLAGDSEAFACSIVSNGILDSPFNTINRSKDTLLSFAFLI